MRMLRTLPFFPQNRGKNHFWKYFPDSACGAIFGIISNNFCIQIPTHWNLTSATLNHIRFTEFHHKIKDNERNLCQDLLATENTISDLKVQALRCANELLVHVRLSFQKLLQTRSTCMQKQYEKMFWKRVMTRTRCR